MTNIILKLIGYNEIPCFKYLNQAFLCSFLQFYKFYPINFHFGGYLYSNQKREILLILIWGTLVIKWDIFQRSSASIFTLTLKLPVTTIVALSSACDSKSHFCKQCGPRSDCFSRSSLIWVHTVCLYAKIGLKVCKNIQQTTFSDAGFIGILRVKRLSGLFVYTFFVSKGKLYRVYLMVPLEKMFTLYLWRCVFLKYPQGMIAKGEWIHLFCFFCFLFIFFFFQGSQLLWLPVLSCTPTPSEKGSTLKGKDSRFFPFSIDFFSEGD